MADVPEGCMPFDRTELGACAGCGEGVAHGGHLDFYEISIGQVILDASSIQQIAGLEMQLGGNAVLAAAFAPTTRVAIRLPAKRILLCSDCFLNGRPSLPCLWSDD